MAFRIVHCNINVTDLNKSIAFYEQALGLQVARKLEAEDGSFTLCYLQDDTGSFQAVSALRTKRWEFILFMIRMTTGWRLFRHRNLFGYT